MSTLCSSEGMPNVQPITTLEYRDVLREFGTPQGNGDHSAPGADAAKKVPRISLTEADLAARLSEAADTATRDAEIRLQQHYERQLEAERAQIVAAVGKFQKECAEYYASVEPEIVNLVLAVAGKILRREAHTDRTLLAALAKVAVEGLQQRSHVILRVPPEVCEEWQKYFSTHLSGGKVEVMEDSQLPVAGCVLETELGTADISIEAQLKEIERGFFDLLAKRPEPR